IDVHRLASAFRFGGVTIELQPGVRVQAFSLWINHLPSVRRQLEDGASGAELAEADSKTRGSEMRAILEVLEPHLARTPDVPVIVGGDFNSGSHLDWTAAAADMPNHLGRIVTWPVSDQMRAAGYIDAFRTAHPDPVAAPGLTW
ncbi:MAG: endonuclease/exonuclease/phosphatase family protein, partial [Planctomycetota bacterium]